MNPSAGIRNSEGFDWHPVTGEMYFSNNGRDKIGNDRPDCTLSWAPEPGMFFGFPYCHNSGDGPPEDRYPGVGDPIFDPDLNAEGQAMNCSGTVCKGLSMCMLRCAL